MSVLMNRLLRDRVGQAPEGLEYKLPYITLLA